MTGSTIKSTVPSDSVKEVRIMTASNTAMPVFKEGTRPPLPPANTQKELRLNKTMSRTGNSKTSTPSIPSMTQAARK